MQCPACSGEDTKVIDSRVVEHDNTVRRRRGCEKCGFRFSTLEEMEIMDLSVIKRDGRHESYSREKVAAGLNRALEKRPISKQEFHSLLAAIERDIYVLNKPEVKTAEIGEVVMRYLQKLDKVAYIRFASVYRAFADVDSFKDEITRLSRARSRSKFIQQRKLKIKRNGTTKRRK